MRVSMLVCAAVVLALPVAAQRGQAPGPPTQLPAADQVGPTGATKSNVVYGLGGKQKLKLDVYLPKPKPASPVPAVVLVHGGAWMEGDKDDMAPMGRWLAKNGYAAFSIDYRLLDANKNQWPVQLEDAQTAVRWIRAHAADYGADPARIGAFGYSAGAQMVAMLGVNSTQGSGGSAVELDPASVQAVAEQAGPVDITAAVYKDADSQQFFTRFMGASYQQDPAKWRAASPALNVTARTPPFLIVHGTRDTDVPIIESVEFRDALKAHGIPVTLVTVDEGHELQSSESKKKLAAETLKFFDATLKESPGH